MTSGPATATPPSTPPGTGARWLDRIERLGNRLPDPAVLFLLLLGVVWVISAVMAPMTWTVIDPRTRQPIQVQNQLTGTALATFLARMVTTFTSFHPLGVVLVALLTGGTLMGITGALLALPFAAVVFMLVEELRVELPGESGPAERDLRANDDRSEEEYSRRAEGVPAEQAAAIAIEIAADQLSAEPETPGSPAGLPRAIPSDRPGTHRALNGSGGEQP